ncbi:MAG: DUF1553 domain-containing protein [Planctomycetaceae bacterium]
MTPQDHRELPELLEALCEERLSPEQHARLDRLVVTDAEARRLYVDYIALHGMLSWDVASAASGKFVALAAAAAAEKQPLRRRSTRLTLGVAAFAASFAVALAVWWLRSPAPSNAMVPSPDSIADGRGSPAVAAPVDPKIEIGGPRRTAAMPEPAPKLEVAVGPGDFRPIDVPVAADVVTAINEEIAAGWQSAEVQPSPVADDAEWVRRVYLDLAGRIPSTVEAELFFADPSADKRAQLVEALLDSPETARNFATVWTNLLIGRTANPELDRAALQRFLQDHFAGNRPWSETVAALITAEGSARENGAANFLLAHMNNEAVPATAITARCFLGMQVQCTQCHAHPFYKEWGQEEFWELNSFFQQTAVERKPSAGGGPMTLALATRDAGGPTYYENRNGEMKVAFPKFANTEIDPGKTTNRRHELARLLVAGDHPQLARAFINRTWAHFFGYGFTNPVDDMGPHNPPTHPALLNRLADEFVMNHYDVRAVFRAICNSMPYQLTSRSVADQVVDDPSQGDPPLFSRMYLKPLTAEQLYDSLQVATLAEARPGAALANTTAQRQNWMGQFFTAEPTEENCESTTFDGTLPQALSMMNGDLVTHAVSAAADTRLAAIESESPDESERIRRICLATLSRYPSREELDRLREAIRHDVRQQVQSGRVGNARDALREALRDVYWAYLNSAEFTVNH